MSSCDLVQLAKYSLTSGHLPEVWNGEEERIIDSLIKIYQNLMCRPHLQNFFGLRDFIHFFTYLGRAKIYPADTIKPQSVMEALEHNFNGTKDFEEIVRTFFKAVSIVILLYVSYLLVDWVQT